MKINKCVYIYGGAIGDALLGVHLGRMLSASAPGSQITLIATRENRFVRDLLKPIPFVHLIEMPKWSLHSWVTLLQLGFTPHATAVYEPLSTPIPFWWNLIVRVATIRKGSIDVRCTTHARAKHKRERTIAFDCRTNRVFALVPHVLEQWGIPPRMLIPHLDTGLYQDHSLRVPKPYFVSHFFAPSTLRSEPVSKGRELLSAVQETFPSHQLVLTCTTSEFPRAKRMAEGLNAQVLCDLTPAAIVSLLAGADAYVGVDTGITHIACHTGIPCVVLGNRSNPCWLPYYVPHAIILFGTERCGCNGDKTGDCAEIVDGQKYYRCLLDITEEQILDALQKILCLKK